MSTLLAPGQVITIHQSHWGNVTILAHMRPLRLTIWAASFRQPVADSGKVVPLVLTGQSFDVLANSLRRHYYHVNSPRS